MTREELIRNLKYTMEKHKNDTVNTFGTNISVMCKDILDYLEQEPTKREIEREYLFQSLCEDFKKLQAENDDLIKRLEQEPKWIPVSERLPEDGTYLITRKNIINTPIVSICSFAKNLYLIDDFDFYDKKGKSGWYDYDGEIGYCEVDGIIAWMPLPQPYNNPQKSEDEVGVYENKNIF